MANEGRWYNAEGQIPDQVCELRCELPLFFAGIRQARRRWKALDLLSLNMQFQQDWPKDKKL